MCIRDRYNDLHQIMEYQHLGILACDYLIGNDSNFIILNKLKTATEKEERLFASGSAVMI